MLFGRNRTVKTETVTLPENLRHLQETPEPEVSETEAAPTVGPFDAADRPETEGLMDLGALRIPVRNAMPVRLDVEESSKRIIGVTLTHEQSTMQIQAFAAPRSAGLWDEIRDEIVASVKKNEGAQAGEKNGRFGTEVIARIPAKMSNGKAGWRVARFLGIDGPRWFVRGVFGGKAAFNTDDAAPLEDVLAQVVVNRGDEALPPRELLSLRPPANMRRVSNPVDEEQNTEQTAQNSQQTQSGSAPMPERGPEITETR